MQLVAFTSAALFAATSLASASPDLLTNALKLLQTANDACNVKNPNIKIVNTCDYPVHLWSISKNDVCSGSGLVLQQGDYYQENYRPAVGKTAVSIKLSKSEECDCTKTDITQVEYMIETVGSKRDGVAGNFHDVSFVDCNTFGGKCPGRDGFYLKTGNVNGQWMASDNNEHCPILNCNSKSECATMAYVNPDDVQTKWCQAQANMEFHICGQNSTSGNTQPAASSKQVAASSVAAPSSAAPSSSQAPVSAAAYTPVVTPSPAAYTPNVHTQVVYTTVEVEVEAKKRHVGRHAHRHQHFHA